MVDPREESLKIVPSRYEEWREQFAAERDRLRRVLETRDLTEHCHRVEHVGSTSVPELPAKDIVDIDIVVEDEAVTPISEALVASLGGTRFENSEAWHPIHREHEGQRFNDHVFAVSSDGWKISVVTRDVLREVPALRREYAQLKRELSSDHDDLESYSQGKTPFIERLLQTAREDDTLTFEFAVPEL